MKKLVLTSALVISAISSANAASPTFYGSLKGSFVNESQEHAINKSDLQGAFMKSTDATNDLTNTSVKFALGANVYETEYFTIRAEIEKGTFGEISQNDFDFFAEKAILNNNITVNTKSKNDTWFANGYFDYKANEFFQPYVNVGVGMNTHTFALSRTSGSYFVDNEENTNINFAWNIGAGVSYKVSNKMTLDLGYRYSDLGKSELGYYQFVEGIKTSGGAAALAGSDVTNQVRETRFDHKISTVMHEVLLGVRFNF